MHASGLDLHLRHAWWRGGWTKITYTDTAGMRKQVSDNGSTSSAGKWCQLTVRPFSRAWGFGEGLFQETGPFKMSAKSFLAGPLSPCTGYGGNGARGKTGSGEARGTLSTSAMRFSCEVRSKLAVDCGPLGRDMKETFPTTNTGLTVLIVTCPLGKQVMLTIAHGIVQLSFVPGGHVVFVVFCAGLLGLRFFF